MFVRSTLRVGGRATILMMHSNDFPLITVRIPAYNHEQYVCIALDSVRLQTYPNIEIAIIDDGSTDATATKISEWIEHYGDGVKVSFRTRENRGVAATINELIDISNGEYVVGLASDDYLLPNSIIERYQYLRNQPQKLAVFGDSLVIDSNGDQIYKSGINDLHRGNKEKYLTDKGLKQEIIRNWSVTGSCIMMHRSLHKRFRYDESLKIEDRDFYLKMVSADLLGFVDYPVAAYRVHETNFSLKGRNDLLGSINKFKALTRNINLFSCRDRFLFTKPILSSLLGIVVHYSVQRFRVLFL